MVIIYINGHRVGVVSDNPENHEELGNIFNTSSTVLYCIGHPWANPLRKLCTTAQGKIVDRMRTERHSALFGITGDLKATALKVGMG